MNSIKTKADESVCELRWLTGGRRKWGWGLGLLLACSTYAFGSEFETVVLFETGFEVDEGYSPDLDLAGQNGWVGAGSGGNGILAGPYPEFNGQVAYIGFQAPESGQDQLNLYRSFSLEPVGAEESTLTFQVRFMIFDSTEDTPYYDDFRWSVYNVELDRLFTLDFDNAALEINYVLDDGEGFQKTGFTYEPYVPYDLELVLKFQENTWSASLNGERIVQDQPITTRNARVAITEIDAVWVVRDPANPGDNFMGFDDYRVSVTRAAPGPPEVEAVGLLTNGSFVIRVKGQPGDQYTVESSNNLKIWETVGTGTAQFPSGSFDIQDTVGNQSYRFYRALRTP